MINSTNTVEFPLSRDDVAAAMRRTQMVPSVKPHTEQQQLAYITHQPQKQQPAPQNSPIFLSICSNELTRNKNRNSGIVISEKFTPYTKDKKSFEIVVSRNSSTTTTTNTSNVAYNKKERVKVQHLQTHTKLQNNQWNYQKFCNLNTTPVREMMVMGGVEPKPNTNNNNLNNGNNNNYIKNLNQNESAFKLYKLNESKESTVFVSSGGGILEQATMRKFQPDLQHQQQQQIPSDNLNESDRRSSPVCRTEDQENAFRRIEDVHNYSKLNRYSYSNGSSNSSVHEEDDEDDDDDDDDEDEEEEEVEDDEEEAEIEGDDDEDEHFETYFDRKKEFTKNKHANKDIHMNKTMINIHKLSNKQDNQATVLKSSAPTVTTPTTPTSPVDLDETVQALGAPDHHARRPMNAFLIFCKRHRAIVKDKYKSFENRAITKILGDWWASLDTNDKKCYTNLAQQNKDAFFSANPNFKWYKLPAPPLRTLNTRPTNSERSFEQEDHQLNSPTESLAQNCDHNTTAPHYFKLADEAQMGELSTLLCDQKSSQQINQNALQQALGETTHYLSTQIPDLEGANKWKRKLQHNDNSFSSNSSEEDLLPKKSSRSCKGKIYQELINSGQIAAIAKKATKATKVNNNNNFQMNTNLQPFSIDPNVSQMLYSPTDSIGGGGTAHLQYNLAISECAANKSMAIDCNNAAAANYEIMEPFDLEKKIKELPALSLDSYLQRKRNTKKRKKFNSKKRTTVSGHKLASTSATAPPTMLGVSTCPPITSPKACNKPIATAAPPPPPPPTMPTNPAVGSQKRKARKESITRRDISAIENEVASLLPLREDLTAITCNGRYYYDESPSPIPKSVAYGASGAAQLNSISSPSADLEISDFLSNISNNISSTSDLLILAEVAAKRTEISN